MPDILAIAAHPDDIELSCSGTLLRSVSLGRSIAVCDVTEGERGSRGSREIRRRETMAANIVLGLDDTTRVNLSIPDGNIDVNPENVLKVVRVIRHFRPSIILLPWSRDRHPDHERVHQLVRTAYFNAGLSRVISDWNSTAQVPHRPARMYCFFHTYDRAPDLVVDVSEFVQRKLQAIAAYSSQVTMPGEVPDDSNGQPNTFISQPGFIESVMGRMRHWGQMIDCEFGEAFCSVGPPIKINDLHDTI